MKKEHSNGATASYYEIPAGATQLQDLISDRDMNAQIGEVFRACYRYGRVSHSDKLRDAKKILFYAQEDTQKYTILKHLILEKPIKRLLKIWLKVKHFLMQMKQEEKKAMAMVLTVLLILYSLED